MNNYSRYFLAFLFCGLVFGSCRKEDNDTEEANLRQSFLSGKYVVNEGSYNQNNSGVSFIDSEYEIVNDVFLMQNNFELGDILQSFEVIGSRGYAVVNNSQKVEVIDLNDFKRVASITGFSYPRYMVEGPNGIAYVSDGSMAGSVKVIDLAANAIVSEVATGNGPDKMLIQGDRLYVCNSGGFLSDNSITVINTVDNSVLATIQVGDRPGDIVSDAGGNLWVLCSGETFYDGNWNVTGHSDAMLFKIDPVSLSVVTSAQIGITGDHPLNLEISPSGSVLYYENAGVFAFNVMSGELPGDLVIPTDMGSLSIDPTTGEMWCASVADYVNPSTVYQYQANGTLIRSYLAGIGTNAVAFP